MVVVDDGHVGGNGGRRRHCDSTDLSFRDAVQSTHLYKIYKKIYWFLDRKIRPFLE